MSNLVLSFGNHLEFVTANCVGCPKREQQGCRDVDPMTCQRAVDLVKIQNEKGYQVVVGKFIIQPKKNLMEYREFTDDDLDLIRDYLAEHLNPNISRDSDDEILNVINIIQTKLNCPTFKNIEQFHRNTSNTWNEIIEEGGES